MRKVKLNPDKPRTRTVGRIFHVIKRAKERKGLNLSLADIQSIIDIVDSKNKTVCKNREYIEGGYMKAKVFYMNVWFNVIYDKKFRELVTILPDEEEARHGT